MVRIINDLAKTLNKSGQADTVTLDFEKAFNTPLHESPSKCKLSYGNEIGGKTLTWIDSFLCDRQQHVEVNVVQSDRAPVYQVSPGHNSWTIVILAVHQ